MSAALYYTYQQPQQQSMSYNPNVNQSQQQGQQPQPPTQLQQPGMIPNGFPPQYSQQQPRIPIGEASFFPPLDPNSIPTNFNNNNNNNNNVQRIRQQMVNTMSNNPSYTNSNNSKISSSQSPNENNNTNQKVINENQDQINDKIILPPITSIIEKNGNNNNNNNNNKNGSITSNENNSNTTPEREFVNITPETTTIVNTVPINGTNTISPPLKQVKMEPQLHQIPATMPPSINNNISPTTPNVITWDPMNNNNSNNNEEMKYMVPNGQNPNIVAPPTNGAQFYTPNMYYQPPPGFPQQQQQMQPRPNEPQQQAYPPQYQYYMPVCPQQGQNPQQFQQQGPSQQMLANRNFTAFQPNYIPQPQQQYIDRKGSIAMMPVGNFSVMNPAMYPHFATYNVAEDIDNPNGNGNNINNENHNSKKSNKKRKNSKSKNSDDLQPSDIDSLEEEALENAVSINNIPSLATIQTNLNIAKRLRKQCPVCGKICSRPSTLKTHYLIHSGDTPFKCTWKGCTKSFNVKSNMLRHLKSHKRKLQKELLKKEIELRKAGGTSNFTSFADATSDANLSLSSSNSAPINSTNVEHQNESSVVPSVNNITESTNAPGN